MKGFTFIEVLVAMLIFVIAAVTAISLVHGAVRATRDTKEVTVATWLLQNVMAELETKIETQGFDRGCEEKSEARFPEPYQDYKWLGSCTQVDFHISQTAEQLAAQENQEEELQKNDAISKLILGTASQYISDSMREIHAEVHWMQGDTPKVVTATTHVARLDVPVNLPGIPQKSGGTGGTGGTQDSGSGTPTPNPGGGTNP